jgi:uncharacterized protein YndB with AHSA1/START domain
MIHHEVTVHVNRPAEQVFAFLVDPEKLVLWQSNLVKTEILTEGPLRAGSRFREVRMLRGKESEIRGEISDFEPNRQLATKTADQPQVTVRYALHPENGGTQLSYQFAMRSAGLRRLLEPVILKSVRKESESDLQRLKQLLGG